MKTPDFRFHVHGKRGFFENNWVTIITTFSCARFRQKQIHNDCECCVFKCLGRSLDGIHFMRFQSTGRVTRSNFSCNLQRNDD